MFYKKNLTFDRMRYSNIMLILIIKYCSNFKESLMFF